MPTISAGASAVVAVPRGSALKTSGTGVAVRANQPTGLQGSNSFGPYDSDQSVCISAASQVDYIISSDVSALPIARATQDSAGNQSIVTPTGPVPLGTKGYGSRVANLSGGQRMAGNSQYVTGASGVKTQNLKIEAEAPFTAVRVWVGAKNNSGTPPVFSAVVAPTETMVYDTVNNAFVPRVGGTFYNALVSTSYGWRAVTWDGGAATKTGSLAPAAANSAAYNVSDWVPCVSVPRVDVVGGRPAALLKLAQTDAAGVFSQLVSALTTYNAKRGAAAYREMISTLTSNDGVGTLTNLPASVATTGNAPMYAWLEFQYAVPTRSVAIVGDSTHENAYNEFGSMSWVDIALRELSTQAAPIAVTNLAGSGHSHTEYMLLLDYMLTAGFVPTDIVFQGWSQNGFGGNIAGADALIARDTAYLQKLRNAGVQVWMSTSYGVNGYSTAAEAGRLKCLAQIKAWAASGLVNLLDTDAIITDYSGGTGALKAQYNSGDNVHANPLGQRAMADMLKSLWI